MFFGPSRCWTLCIITSRSWSNYTRSDVITRHLNGIHLLVTVKGKVYPGTGYEDPRGGGQRYGYNFSLTSALERGVSGQQHAPAALPPGKRPGTHCIRGWVGPRAGLDGYGKPCPHWNSIPGQSSLQQVSISTALFRFTFINVTFIKVQCLFAWLYATYKHMFRCNLYSEQSSKSDVWLTVHRNSLWIRKTN